MNAHRATDPVSVLREIQALNGYIKDLSLDRYIALELPSSVFDALQEYLNVRMLITSPEPLARMTEVLGRRIYRISEAPND